MTKRKPKFSATGEIARGEDRVLRPFYRVYDVLGLFPTKMANHILLAADAEMDAVRVPPCETLPSDADFGELRYRDEEIALHPLPDDDLVGVHVDPIVAQATFEREDRAAHNFHLLGAGSIPRRLDGVYC
jgi:hypothetical protein